MFLDIDPRNGPAVTGEARCMCQQQRKQLLAQRLALVLSEALAAGLDADEVRKLCDAELVRLARKQR